MKNSINTVITVQNSENYFRTLKINDLQLKIQSLKTEISDFTQISGMLLNLSDSTAACEINKKFEEHAERARLKMRAAYRVLTAKQLSHEN